MDERDAPERPGSPWPMVIVGGLAVFGAVVMVQWVFSFLFGLIKLAIVVAVVLAVLALVFRGPPDRRP